LRRWFLQGCSILIRKPFNPQSLISHLTNSNECGNLQAKVLLTVSPLPPFFLPQPSVCSPNRRLLPSHGPRGANISPILSTLRIPPVATGVHPNPFRSYALTSVSQCLCGKSNILSSLPPLCRSLRSFSHRLPLFSIACGLFLQNAGGWGVSGCSRRSDAPFASRMYLRDLRTFRLSDAGALPPRHGADTEATVGSRGGKAAVGEKCATGLSY
jgi:hypothetical protein